MRTVYTLSWLALSIAATAPAAAQDDPRIAELEAKLSAQEARVRALEAQLRQLIAEKAPAPTPQPVRQTAAAPTIKLRGRLQVDALVVNDGTGATPTGTQVRRFYLGAEGVAAPGLRYQAEADFAGNRASIQDALVAYQASPTVEIVGGYLKPSVTADEMTSDVSTLFLERSAFASTFAPGRRVGLAVNYAGAGWGLRGGLFGEREDAPLDGDRSEGWLASARAHADLLPGDAVLHIAASAYYSRTGSDHRVQLSQRPEANRAPVMISTGSFEADDVSFLGGEVGYGLGSLTAQVEGGVLRFAGPATDALFWGWSAQLGWRLTGEERPYDVKTGIFGRVVPRQAFGAVEAGLRFTQVDLDDGIAGGRLDTFGAVLNWYPVTRLRIAGNVIHAVSRRPGAADVSQNLITLRGAIDW